MQEKEEGLGIEKKSLEEATVSESGVKKNTEQMNAKLGKVAENEEFLYDNAAENPAGEDAATSVEGTRYSKKSE